MSNEVKINKYNLTVIIDTREQKNKHIEKFLNDNNISYYYRKLEFGDYTFEYENVSFFDKIVVERKANLGELSNNLTKDRERFVNEHERCKTAKAKMVWMIEEGNINDIYSGNYNTLLHKNAYIGSVLSFQSKYSIQIDFIPKIWSGRHILNVFYYYLREIWRNISGL